MLPHDIKQLADTNSFFVTNPVLPENEIQRRLFEQQKLIQTSLDGFLVVGVTNGRIIEANDAFCGMLGYSRQELLSMGISDLEADESPAETSAHIKKVMDVGYDRFEARHRHKQGQLIDLEISVSHSELDGGTNFVFARNITERKRMEEALANRERELRALAESSPGMMGCFYLRPDGSVCMPYVSRNIQEFFGLTPLDVAIDATPLMALNHPDDAKMVQDSIAESARTLTTWHVAYRILHPAKGERWMESNTNPQPHPDGGVIWYGYVHDITESRQTEEALRVSEERMRLFFERQVVGMAITSPEKGWIQVNDKICEMLGYSREELVRLTWAELTYPDDLAADVAQFEQMLGGKIDSCTLEKRYVRKDGGIVFTNLAVSCVRRADRSVDYVLALLEDITERKRAERELQAHARSLECMDRINQAIQGTNDLEQMMRDVLDVVLSIFDCDRAFLVYPCDPDAIEWQAPMERTRPEYPGTLALGRVVPMDEEVAGLMRILLDTAGPARFGPGAEFPLPLDVSEQFGIQSQMLMTLHPKLDQPWQFGIHQCSHARDWTADDAVLFQKIGWRLSDSLTSLSMYRNLQASEQQFRTLAENMPDTLIRYDREGRRTYINPALKRISAVREEQMIGLTQQESNPFQMPEAYRLALAHTLASGERSEIELQIPTPSGDIRTNLVSIAAERATDGQVTGAICIGHDITESKQAEHQLRELTAHLQTVREEEKAHLAREIHDELGSILLALRIETHLLNSGLSADQKKMPLFERVESMVDLLDDAMKATRNIINDLRPTVLDDLGLMAALEWQAAQFYKHTGIECRVACLFRKANGCTDCKDCEYTLDKTLSINLFRVLQEALNNVAQHSGASRVEVELQPSDHEIVLSISDNGCGLPEGNTFASTSYGIRGMRERVQHLTGKIELGEAPGGGLRVMVRVPLPPA